MAQGRFDKAPGQRRRGLAGTWRRQVGSANVDGAALGSSRPRYRTPPAWSPHGAERCAGKGNGPAPGRELRHADLGRGHEGRRFGRVELMIWFQIWDRRTATGKRAALLTGTDRRCRAEPCHDDAVGLSTQPPRPALEDRAAPHASTCADMRGQQAPRAATMPCRSPGRPRPADHRGRTFAERTSSSRPPVRAASRGRDPGGGAGDGVVVGPPRCERAPAPPPPWPVLPFRLFRSRPAAASPATTGVSAAVCIDTDAAVLTAAGTSFIAEP